MRGLKDLLYLRNDAIFHRFDGIAPHEGTERISPK